MPSAVTPVLSPSSIASTPKATRRRSVREPQ
jgi:hypothetical protein